MIISCMKSTIFLRRTRCNHLTCLKYLFGWRPAYWIPVNSITCAGCMMIFLPFSFLNVLLCQKPDSLFILKVNGRAFGLKSKSSSITCIAMHSKTAVLYIIQKWNLITMMRQGILSTLLWSYLLVLHAYLEETQFV